MEILKFYESIKKEYHDKETVTSIIREFALNHVSMASVMEPIIDFIG